MGMIIMLLPPFAAVKYDELFVSLRSIPKRLAFDSVLVNWAMLGTGLVRFSTWVFGKGKTWDLGDFKVKISFLKLEVTSFFLVFEFQKRLAVARFWKSQCWRALILSHYIFHETFQVSIDTILKGADPFLGLDIHRFPICRLEWHRPGIKLERTEHKSYLMINVFFVNYFSLLFIYQMLCHCIT